jgi:hypothetical protein
MKDLDPEVEQAVDAICALGCDVVAAYIESLRQRQQRPEYRLLNETQRSSLLRELQSIMSVYDSKNP